MPPAFVKLPATYRLFPSKTRAFTGPLTPEPRDVQALPSQRAIPLTVMPPALVNAPPTYTSPLVPTAIARTSPSTPTPRLNQFVPSHRAILPTPWLPAELNRPPT